MKVFRFSIQSPSGEYYAIDPTGSVVVQSAYWELPESPQAWETTSIALQRNKTYDGMIRVFNGEGASYAFVSAAKKIFGYILRTQGKEGKARLIVDIGNNYILTAGNLEFQRWASLDVDFSTSNVDIDYFNVGVADTGPAAWLQANQGKTVSVPIAAPYAVPLVIDGVLLGQDESLSITTNSYTSNTTTDVEGHQFTPDLEPIFSQSDMGVNSKSVTTKVDSSTLITSDFFFYKASAGTAVQATLLELDIVLELSPTAIAALLANQGLAPVVSIRRVNAANTKVADYDFQFNSAPYVAAGGVVTRLTFGEQNLAIPVNAGDRLAFFIGLRDFNGNYNDSGQASGFEQEWKVRPMTLRLRYGLRNPASPITYGLRPPDLWNQMIKLLSDGKYGGISNLLSDSGFSREANWDLRPFNCLFLSGNAVRGLADANDPTSAPIKTSIQQFFQHWNSQQGVGIGFDGNNIRLEKLEYFYSNGIPTIRLGEVADLHLECANDLTFTGAKVGYTGATSDQVNALFAFNGTQEWAWDGERNPKVIELVSPYLADMYAIESLRIETTKRDTADNRQDNVVAVIDVEDTLNNGAYYPYRPQNLPNRSLFGVPGPEYAYNVALHPKLVLYRNPRIRPSFYGYPSSARIRFLSAEKNADINTNLPGGFSQNTADIPIANLPPSYCQPYYLKFRTISPTTLFALSPQEFYAPSTFTFDGVTYKGYVDGLSNNPATYAAFECVFLAHPDTDISPFL